MAGPADPMEGSNMHPGYDPWRLQSTRVSYVSSEFCQLGADYLCAVCVLDLNCSQKQGKQNKGYGIRLQVEVWGL